MSGPEDSGSAAEVARGPSTAEQGLYVRSPRVFDFVSAALNLLFAAALLVLLGSDLDVFGAQLVLVRLMLAGGAGVMTWSGVRWLTRAWDARPRISIDSDGIVDRTGLGPEIVIPWNSILSLSATPSGLEVTVRDRSGIRLSLHRRFLTRILRHSRDSDLIIPLAGLELPKDAIAGLALARHDAYLIGALRTERQQLEGSPSDDGAADEGMPQVS